MPVSGSNDRQKVGVSNSQFCFGLLYQKGKVDTETE